MKLHSHQSVLLGGAAVFALTACTDDPTSSIGPPASVAIVAGGLQAAPPGEPAPVPLTVAVREAQGIGVANVTVAWDVTVGDGSVSNFSSQTDIVGETSTVFTVGSTLGTHRVTATVAGLPPATFAVTGIVTDSDPSGDTFATGASSGLTIPDLTLLGAGVDGDSLILHLRFTAELVPLSAFEAPVSNEMLGFIDIDLDQDAATGTLAIQDELGLPGAGSSEMGVDAFVVLDPTNTIYPLPLSPDRPNGSFPVFRVDSVVINGADTVLAGPQPITVQPAFDGRTLTIAVPLSFLNADDGTVNVSAAVGSGALEFTDFAPNTGHLTVTAATSAMPLVAVGPAPRGASDRGNARVRVGQRIARLTRSRFRR